MEHNPISMGDLAYAAVSAESATRDAQMWVLRQRVDLLEQHVDYLVGVLNALLDRMYGDRIPEEIVNAAVFPVED